MMNVSATFIFCVFCVLIAGCEAQGTFTIERPVLSRTQPYGTVVVNGHPVCDDHFDLDDATVVCRMFGYRRVLEVQRVDPGNYYNYPPHSGIFSYTDLKCTGSESSLSSCPHTSQANARCVHGEEAGVVCTNASIFYTLHKDMVTTDAARSSCDSQGKALAMPKTPALWGAFLKVYKRESRGKHHNTWIDIRKTPSGQWVWGDGEVAQWMAWKSGEPDGDGDCVSISSYTGEWYDDACDWKTWYMCQPAVNHSEKLSGLGLLSAMLVSLAGMYIYIFT